MSTIAILGSENLRKEKSCAIDCFLKAGFKILDIGQDYKIHESHARSIGLMENVQLTYVITDGKIDPETAIKIGASYALKIPIAFSCVLKDKSYSEYVYRIAAPETLAISLVAC